MCNDYQRHVEWEAYCHLMQALELGIPAQQSEIDLPPAEDVRINDIAPVMRTRGNVVELVPMRWSFPASRPAARPVFNFRGEGRRFDKDDRIIIPASGFYEFTGTKSPKSKWLFALKGTPMMGIAGIGRMADGRERFTMLTVDPGPDLEGFHDRQVVVLPPRDWATWLYADAPEKELIKPLPAGSLGVTLYRNGKDDPSPDLLARVEG
jgi:putative SOS response-associated peptidase YedK